MLSGNLADEYGRQRMGEIMPNFRAYPLDGEGHFIGATVFEAPDDDEAMRVALSLSDKLCHELWCGARFVGRVSRDETSGSLRLTNSL